MTPQPTDPTTLVAILRRADAREPVAAIALALDVSQGYVYGVLRSHRPGRTRSPRTRNSPKRRMILGLAAQGIAAPRIAFLVDCSAAYVYRLIGEVTT